MRPLVLLVTDSTCVHADRLGNQLKNLGCSFFRLNTDLLLKEACVSTRCEHGVMTGYLRDADHQIDLDCITAVWWFGVEPPQLAFAAKDGVAQRWIANETTACLTTILTALKCPFVNHPNRIAAAANKLTQLSLAEDNGLLTPATVVSHNREDILAFASQYKRIVFKTLSHPQVSDENGTYVVYTSRVSPDELHTADGLQDCVVLLQEEIDKDVEYRVTVVGDQVLPCEIRSQESERTSVDWRRYDIARTPHFAARLPEPVETACRSITKALGLHYSAIDLIRDIHGRFWFLELNPNGLWAWIEILTDLQISRSFAELLIARSLAYPRQP